ncbi:MAG: hypothetical protein GWN84_14450 [Gammaproteobacteria bacterium]|nr:hypothetical protein [Gammaproteobacteria bacterium]NIR84000.1 hypothetical protein [Gammaproteobacteria bacterium]NIR89144.1 hypothetical protein [Gammaproteobacteria bacterium]NIU04946.1 hypothetical protein [Gammaproteobacteria bacterium]NIV52112.1 hypothetical protein [Gammaproteobacteria bacterium]
MSPRVAGRAHHDPVQRPRRGRAKARRGTESLRRARGRRGACAAARGRAGCLRGGEAPACAPRRHDRAQAGHARSARARHGRHRLGRRACRQRRRGSGAAHLRSRSRRRGAARGEGGRASRTSLSWRSPLARRSRSTRHRGRRRARHRSDHARRGGRPQGARARAGDRRRTHGRARQLRSGAHAGRRGRRSGDAGALLRSGCVVRELRSNQRRRGALPAGSGAPGATGRAGDTPGHRTVSASTVEKPVHVTADAATLEGDLCIPAEAQGLVLFAHGSGSSRHSPRNRMVAKTLQGGGIATLLMDLLTAEEEAVDRYTREYRFDIELLASRLVGVTDWVAAQDDTRALALGYFGASTGAAAALIAASRRPQTVGAVVSRGGRPDLAGAALADVEAPTLLIVGGHDEPVIELNRQALDELRCAKALEIVPRATHLFEEPGALEAVARLALDWLRRHLVA